METLDTDALREAARGVVGQYGFLELLMIRCVFFNDGLTPRNPKNPFVRPKKLFYKLLVGEHPKKIGPLGGGFKYFLFFNPIPGVS